MSINQLVNKILGKSIAFIALTSAQSAADNVCFIFHQDEIPEKVKSLAKK